MKTSRMRWLPVLLLTLLCGCATVREMVALRHVDFRYDRISDAAVAGISIGRVASYGDLGAADVARLALAVASKDVPLDLVVHLEGRNPETNDVTARMVAMDWAYLVDGRETVSGSVTRSLSFPPGAPTDVPVAVSFNLVRFFGGDGRELLQTALVLAGQRTSERRVSLRILPTIDTPAGPMKYPGPIEIALTSGPR
jgi:hypothetical protein